MLKGNRHVKKVLLCLIVIIWCKTGISQELLKIVSAPPDVSALMQFTNIPVCYFTGVPGISNPIYNIKVNGFSLPISLSYHASGIKVEQEASWVGLGWTLNANGLITCVIRGRDDIREK